MVKNFKNAINKTNLNNKGGIAGLVGNFNKSNTDNINNNDDKSNTDNTSNTNVRQTFIVNTYHLERLKDYVYYKRTSGDAYYTQKQAIYDAIELLLNTVNELPKRILK